MSMVPGMTVMLKRRQLRFPAAGPMLLTLGLLLAGCGEDVTETAVRQATRVDVVVAARKDHSRSAFLTGVISARVTNNLAFRTAGRVVERHADVGQHVAMGEVLARLDPAEQEADIAAAQANVDAANAQLTQASTNFTRQKELLPKGLTSQKVFDQAQESLRVARGTLDGATATLANARQNLTFTELRATSNGMVTSRTIEVGQTVQAAQTVFTIAEDGDRDAVFNVPEVVVAASAQPPPVTLRLLSDPDLTTVGKIREMSPVLDPETGSVRVKVEIPETPAAMTLGAAVVGSVPRPIVSAIELPWSALFSKDGRPAVWVVDPSSKAVLLKTVDVAAYEDGSILVGGGLEPGEQVVVAGVQLLSTGLIVDVREGKTP